MNIALDTHVFCGQDTRQLEHDMTEDQLDLIVSLIKELILERVERNDGRYASAEDHEELSNELIEVLKATCNS